MSLIYCLKCKKHTNTDEEREEYKKRRILKGLCVECGTRKNKFIKSAEPIESENKPHE